MAIETGFLPQALRTISDAVVAIIAKTNLHVRADGVSKRMAQRASEQLRALEHMLHRVLVLMALALCQTGVRLAGVAPRIRRIDLFSAPAPVARARRALKPHVPTLPCPYRQREGQDFSMLPERQWGKPVNLARLIRRIQVLQAVLANPAPQARRLARRFARLAARRAPLPTPPPDIPIRRARAELSLIAGVLPMELSRAMAPWQNSS